VERPAVGFFLITHYSSLKPGLAILGGLSYPLGRAAYYRIDYS
jgi:hypothetical protein